METKTFLLSLPTSLSAPSGATTVQSRGSVVVLGPNGSGKTRFGSWLEFQSEQKDKVHRISAQKSLTMPIVSTSTAVDAAKADLIYGYGQGDIGQLAANLLDSLPGVLSDEDEGIAEALGRDVEIDADPNQAMTLAQLNSQI